MQNIFDETQIVNCCNFHCQLDALCNILHKGVHGFEQKLTQCTVEHYVFPSKNHTPNFIWSQDNEIWEVAKLQNKRQFLCKILWTINMWSLCSCIITISATEEQSHSPVPRAVICHIVSFCVCLNKDTKEDLNCLYVLKDFPFQKSLFAYDFLHFTGWYFAVPHCVCIYLYSIQSEKNTASIAVETYVPFPLNGRHLLLVHQDYKDYLFT